MSCSRSMARFSMLAYSITVAPCCVHSVQRITDGLLRGGRVQVARLDEHDSRCGTSRESSTARTVLPVIAAHYAARLVASHSACHPFPTVYSRVSHRCHCRLGATASALYTASCRHRHFSARVAWQRCDTALDTSHSVVLLHCTENSCSPSCGFSSLFIACSAELFSCRTQLTPNDTGNGK